jgi:hypothetical protein
MVDFPELTSFITSLAENPQLAQRFRENPRAVIAEAELSEATKKLLTLERESFLSEVLTEARPKVTVKTSVHVSTNINTNVNNHVTTHVIVVLL